MADFFWTRFEYTSGANPYIAKTDEERKRIIEKYEKQGIEVEEVVYSSRDYDTKFYIIHDRKEA